MGKLQQVIVRNKDKTGLDVVASTLAKSQLHNISHYLPSAIPHEFHQVFLTKFKHPIGAIVLRFVYEDGVDEWGRKRIKTHSLIIDPEYYNKKTIHYFITPFVNGTVNVEEDHLLSRDDFRGSEPVSVSSKFIELALCKKHLHVSSQKPQDSLDLIQIFASIDRVIPPLLNSRFSFQTMLSLNNKKHFKKRSMIFISKKLNQTVLLEHIQQEVSDFFTVQMLAEALVDLPALRRLQQKLFKNVPERRLKLKIRWRFGIKTFSNARKNVEAQFGQTESGSAKDPI